MLDRSEHGWTWIINLNQPNMSQMFKPVGSRQLLSKTVEEEIVAAIRANGLTPGTRLPTEHELCAQFGVSRTVLREALRMLSARGLVTIEKGRGIFVSQITADTIVNSLQLYLSTRSGLDSAFDLVHARQVLEPPVAALAALNHTDQEAEALKEAFSKMKKGEEDLAELPHLDMAFHLAVAKASGNPLFPLLLKPIHQLMQQIVPSVYETVAEAKEVAMAWHAQILDAILRRDANAASEAMARHLEFSEEHTRQVHGVQKTDGKPVRVEQRSG